MASKYQMWLTYNGEKEKIRFPVLPETISVSDGSGNKSVEISGLGEITIKQGRPAIAIKFNGFFPAVKFPGMQTSSITLPKSLKNKITGWKNGSKPVHFIITGTDINMYCTIEEFSCDESGGDVGTIYYTLSLKEYREVKARQVKVEGTTRKATLPSGNNQRTDNRVVPKTYTVVKGDCLWNIAAKYLGSGSRYKEIYNLNKNIIKNPDLIYPGQVLKMPG